MRFFLLALALLSCASNQYVIVREPGTCLVSEDHPEPLVVVMQWGWSVKLRDARDRSSRVLTYTNDERWQVVACPKVSK